MWALIPTEVLDLAPLTLRRRLAFACKEIQIVGRDPGRGGLGRLGRELEVVEDLAKYGRIGDECEYDHGSGTPRTGQGIDVERAAQ